MRAVGFDPNGNVLTMAAGPRGVIILVVVQEGRTHKVRVEPKEVGGAAVAPPVAVTCSSYQTDEMLARAVQAELNAADAAKRAVQEACDGQYARSIGRFITETPVYLDSESDSVSSYKLVVHTDSAPASSEAWSRTAMATANRFDYVVSPDCSRGRSLAPRSRRFRDYKMRHPEVDRAAAEFAASKTLQGNASPDLAPL